LYQWVKAVRPDKTEQLVSELIETKCEQPRRTKEEHGILKKAARYTRIKYRFINKHRHEFQIMARLLGFLRFSYEASGGVYGAPRVFLGLREDGELCGKHRVARLMSVNKIKALHGYKAIRVLFMDGSRFSPLTGWHVPLPSLCPGGCG